MNKRSKKYMRVYEKNARLQCRQKKCYEPTLQTPAISVMYMGVNTYTSAGTHMSWVSSRLSPLPCGCAVYVLKVCPGDIAFGGSSSGSCTAREFWKAHILSLRSFADICARACRLIFRSHNHGWNSEAATQFSETVNLVAWDSHPGHPHGWLCSY